MRIRSVVAVVSGAAMLLAQMPSGYAQNAGPPVARLASVAPAADTTPSPAIVDAFKAFPKAGEGLSKRIADIIVKDPKLAAGLAKYVQTANLSTPQKLAAEKGLAEALKRLGIKAADMPVKAPPPQVGYDYTWLLALAAVAVLICVGVCRKDEERPVSPH